MRGKEEKAAHAVNASLARPSSALSAPTSDTLFVHNALTVRFPLTPCLLFQYIHRYIRTPKR